MKNNIAIFNNKVQNYLSDDDSFEQADHLEFPDEVRYKPPLNLVKNS